MNNIIQFVKDKTGEQKVFEESNIEKDLHCNRDDFHELIDEYSKKYDVDMSSYLWYFHTGEEGQSFGSLFFEPSYKRVNRIPVTPKMLFEFSQTKKWDLVYPEHKIPKRRYDILINTILVILVLFYLVYRWLSN